MQLKKEKQLYIFYKGVGGCPTQTIFSFFWNLSLLS